MWGGGGSGSWRGSAVRLAAGLSQQHRRRRRAAAAVGPRRRCPYQAVVQDGLGRLLGAGGGWPQRWGGFLAAAAAAEQEAKRPTAARDLEAWLAWRRGDRARGKTWAGRWRRQKWPTKVERGAWAAPLSRLQLRTTWDSTRAPSGPSPSGSALNARRRRRCPGAAIHCLPPLTLSPDHRLIICSTRHV